MWKKNESKWDEVMVREAVANSISYREALSRLGMAVSGGNYANLKHCIEKYGIDKSHMTHRVIHNKGKTYVTAKGLDGLLELLQPGTNLSTHNLKLRLWKYDLLEKRCASCGITEWMGKEAPLQLDHIDGDRMNNVLENLRILCPNCHAQTDTWTGKNRKAKTTPELKLQPEVSKKIRKKKEDKFCLDCGKSIYYTSTRCKPCTGVFREPTVIEWPSNEELLDRLSKSNYSALGRELGVSDKAVQKRLRGKAVPSGTR